MTSSGIPSTGARPLIQHLVPIRHDLARTALQVLLGVAFLALLAQLRFAIGPVPITGQTLGVLLLGAAYGAGLSALTVGAYLLVGTAGLGVFAGGASGAAVFAGASGGYLIGFLAAATLVGFLAERGWDRTFGGTALAMLIGNAVIYAFGLLWLSQLAPDVPTLLQWGLLPFLPGDALKLALAALVVPGVWRLAGRFRG